jgi:asparagine N-glycosylation enzyme membrane subunit Stt3
MEEEIIKERKEKLIRLIKKNNIWIIGFLIIALILGVYIRSIPMQDHNPNLPGTQPGLWDITTNSWTLGPDLDPFLFLRYAKIIVDKGSIPQIDYMRNVPLGLDTTTETRLLPNMIAYTYYFFSFFDKETTINFAGVIFPVIMFALTILSFFLFVREIFIRESKESKTKANIISIIATFFMIVVPVFLARTIAGIPEKESASFFFMFLAFYLFLKSWKSDKLRNSIILAIFSGISTALMGLIWGGVIYIFLTISISNVLAIIIEKIKNKEFFIYSAWLISSIIGLFSFSNKYSFISFIKSTQYLLVFITFFVLLVNFILWNTKVSKSKVVSKISNYNIPKGIISILISGILGIIIISIIFSPSFIIEKINDLIKTFINPTTGRWGVTVAENAQPYYSEWAGNFGPFIKNIPITFWLFFIGSVVLFKSILKEFRKKDAWILTGLYILFFFGLVFSRYARHPAVFDGENFISKFFYFGSAFLLFCTLIYYYIQYEKRNEKVFEKIDYEYLFLFSLFILTLFTVRSAVRLIMVLGPIAPIFIGYLIVKSVEVYKKSKDETNRILIATMAIIIIVLSLFAWVTFFNGIKIEAYSYVPSSYTYQWQKAMEWVRNDTPTNAVFAHWWDYGYWVQTIGNRATVVDGGNAITYWNYLMGRLVLTGDNQKDALEFLYNHNATYLLIDSSDIGKYTAFSSIGSDENYDRYSWIGTFLLNETQTIETKNQTIYAYLDDGVTATDEDLIINESGKDVLLPQQRVRVGAILIPTEKEGNSTKFSQPYAIFFYQGLQHKADLRYLYINGDLIDFKSGIDACAYIFPYINPQQNGGIGINRIGAAMYLSPRLMRGMLSNIYLLNDPQKRYPNFKLVHTEQSLLVDNLNQQGANLPDFVYYGGVYGPIKIWGIDYTGNETIKQEYLDKDASKYLNWSL